MGMSARKQVRIQVHLRTWGVRNMNRRRDIVLTVILTLTGLSSGLRSMEDLEEDVEVNVPVELEEGLVVTVIKRPAKCLREAAVGDHLTVHYPGHVSGREEDTAGATQPRLWGEGRPRHNPSQRHSPLHCGVSGDHGRGAANCPAPTKRKNVL